MEMTLEEFRNEVLTAMSYKPKHWRDGQFVFNYINKNYRVARYVQFIDGIDCFYNDSNIDAFIVKCHEALIAAEENKNTPSEIKSN